MIFVAVFIILFNLGFVESITLFSGVSLEGLKFLPALYIAILHLTLSSDADDIRQEPHDLTVLKAYLTIVTVSLFFSMSPEYSLRALVPWVTIYLLLFLITRHINSYRDQLEAVFFLIMAIGMGLSIVNILIGIVSNQAFAVDDSGITRLAFLKAFPYWYAQTIAMSGFLYYFKGRYHSNRAYLVISLLVMLFLVLSGIRTYVFAYIGAIFLVEAFIVAHSKIKIIVFSFLAGSIISLLVFAYEPFRTKMFITEASTIADMVKNVRISERDKIAAYLIGKSYDYSGLATGTGAGTAKYLLEKERVFDNTVVSHSDYIRIITEFGIIGLLIYAVLMYYWIRQSIHLLRSTNLSSRHFACAYASSVCFIVIGGLAYDLYTPVNVFFAYILYLLSIDMRRFEPAHPVAPISSKDS